MLKIKSTKINDVFGMWASSQDTTGVYSSFNPNGYGGPNLDVTAFKAAIISLCKFGETAPIIDVYTESTDLTLTQITSGAVVTSNSYSMGITGFGEPLKMFHTALYEMGYHLVRKDGGVVVRGVRGNMFLEGADLTPIQNKDYIYLGDHLYKIDKVTFTNGIKRVYVQSPLERNYNDEVANIVVSSVEYVTMQGSVTNLLMQTASSKVSAERPFSPEGKEAINKLTQNYMGIQIASTTEQYDIVNNLVRENRKIVAFINMTE